MSLLPGSLLSARLPSSVPFLHKVPLCTDDAEESLSPESRRALGGLMALETRGSEVSLWAADPLKGLVELGADRPVLAGSPSCLTVELDTGLGAAGSPVPLARWPGRLVFACPESPLVVASRRSPVRRASGGLWKPIASARRWVLGLAARGLPGLVIFWGEKLPPRDCVRR